MGFSILIIVILIILIVWWALLRNARKYKPDFPVHTHEEEHATAPGADTYTAETAASHAMGMEPPPVVEEAPKAEIFTTSAEMTTPPVEPPAAPAAAPADQPFATDYGTPAPESAAEMGTANIFETRAPEMKAAVSDDLAILEGIGPRVKEVLAGAGITTFAGLAATDVNQLRQILEGANLRFIDPTTWPEQAQLAAEGRMEELQTLMNSLRGGRRVADG